MRLGTVVLSQLLMLVALVLLPELLFDLLWPPSLLLLGVVAGLPERCASLARPFPSISTIKDETQI
jgi:hypothetical protein